jgi:hypothetical protein
MTIELTRYELDQMAEALGLLVAVKNEKTKLPSVVQNSVKLKTAQHQMVAAIRLREKVAKMIQAYEQG